ncbi:MAG: outer membrane beta-barrel protein [Cyclobacteriaceae bacterium]
MNIGLQLEYKGNKYSVNGFNVERNFFHLNMPINYLIDFDEDESGLKLNLGFYTGALIGSNLTLQNINNNQSETFRNKDLDNKTFDYGVNIGLAYSYEKVLLKLIYNRGSFDIYGDGSDFINIMLGCDIYFN